MAARAFGSGFVPAPSAPRRLAAAPDTRRWLLLYDIFHGVATPQ